MPPQYSEEVIAEVLQKSDLVEVISSYTSLKKTGKSYKGICPFHQEKTPSFVVDPQKGLYHCFGCGAGGNLFSFLQALEKISFPEAVKLAAQRASVHLPVTTSPEEERQERLRRKILALQEEGASFFQEELTRSREARAYLKDRGYTQEMMETFRLGYAPPGWDHLLSTFQKQDVPPSLLEKAGLVVAKDQGEGYYDRFRHRIIFPIFSQHGQILGFGGRVLGDGVPKYLNSPQTICFHKKNVLYGLYQNRDTLRETGVAVVVEGYTDVITAYQAGIGSLVASLGTSLTPSQARLLRRYVSRVYIAYDADTAGTKATWRGLDILEQEDLIVEVIPVPQGLDPDDLIVEKGKDAFVSLMNRSLSLFDFKLKVILEDKEIQKTEEKVKASQEIFEVLSQVKNRIRQEEYLKKTAPLLQISLPALQEEFYMYLQKKGGKGSGGRSPRASRKKAPFDLQKELLMWSEEKLLINFIAASHHRVLIKKNLHPHEYISTQAQELARFLYEQEDLLLKGPDALLTQLEDPELKATFSRLHFLGEREPEPDPLLSIRRLKEYRWMEEKNRIWEGIRERKKDYDLMGLNRLLLEFCRLLAEEENFEERRGNYAG